jgi:hypothetical protein
MAPRVIAMDDRFASRHNHPSQAEESVLILWQVLNRRPMRQRAPEPDTFLMRRNCVVAIATSSLLVRSCKLLCSCRDAARRRCHEFRPNTIGDRFAQDPIDFGLCGRIEPPARRLVDRL